MKQVAGVAVFVLVLGGGWYALAGGRGGPEPACLADVGAELGLTDEQATNAGIIAEVGDDEGMPDRAIVVALAAAMQESGLRNLDYGDRDSLGLFQQRPSQGWGTPAQVTDPEHAARSFYRSLGQVDGWEHMRVTDAAQAVQISAYPEAYQRHVPAAERLAEGLERCGSR